MSGIPDLAGRMTPWLERAWLQRYLDGALDPAEVAAFEAYLLDKPHLLAHVEADNQLRAAIAVDPGLLLDVRGTDSGPGPGVQEPRESYRVPVAWASMAAGLVLGVGLAWFGLARFADPEVGVAIPPRVVYDTLRGELSAPREEAGDPSSPIRLYELPLPAGATVVAAEAVHHGHSVRLPVAAPSADGYLTYALPASWRGEGELRIDIAFAGERGGATRLAFSL